MRNFPDDERERSVDKKEERDLKNELHGPPEHRLWWSQCMVLQSTDCGGPSAWSSRDCGGPSAWSSRAPTVVVPVHGPRGQWKSSYISSSD
uniref:Uncharacterized protein n=1 Tax=Knipowitschia caucasica TaxID=637954 RepID=A0AAV2M943_KNICA